ncbi:MAG: spondin domain-containing protein, partial [Gammaproteobacteria bacterium]
MKTITLGLALLVLSGAATAGNRNTQYEVTITNITRGQTFTPQLVVTHSPGVRLFSLGEPASEQLSVLAEDGNTGPLTAALNSAGYAVGQAVTIPGLLAAGASARVTVEAGRGQDFLSVAAMLIPTNDTFVA